jgi:vanillin dehydrogenase
MFRPPAERRLNIDRLKPGSTVQRRVGRSTPYRRPGYGRGLAEHLRARQPGHGGTCETRSAAAGPEDAIRAADAAAAAFPAWSGLGPNARRRILLKAAEVLLSKMDEFKGLMAAETGITAGIAENEVRIGADMLVEAASLTTQVGGEIIPSEHPGSLSLAVRQAAGVCVGIAPWNGPISLGVRAIAVALACGNTVILKGSERSPGTHWLIGDALREGGVPDGVINIVINAPGDAGEVVDALIAHPAVKRINFTGSTKVGKSIAETAARFVKPVMLELGGKAPFVVLDDAETRRSTPQASPPSPTRAKPACRPNGSSSTTRSPTLSWPNSPPRPRH